MVFPVALALLLAAPVSESRKESGFDALGVPLLSFNSDHGVGYGAVGGAYFYAPGFRPYRHGLALQVFFTSRGVQNHWLRYDGPKLFGAARLEARLEFRRELFSPFYGPGNQAAPGFVGDPGAADRRFAYDKLFPGAWLRLRFSPLGEDHPFQPYLGYAFRWTSVRPYEESILLSERPPGLEGGPGGQLLLGVLWDTRDDESDPSRGGFEEIGLRLSGAPTWSRHSYGGLTLTERRFFRLAGTRLILAQRLTFDALFGEVPFYEWPNTGGLQYLEGIGGMSSVRGVPRNRYAGEIKLISNTELRYYPYQFPLWGVPVKVGGLVFADLGRAWHPQVEDGPWYRFHPGLGGGVRLTRRAAVVRFDYAVAPESGRQGLYLTFGQMF